MCRYASGKKTQPIASLNPYQGNWTIKAKLSSKGTIRTFRNAKGEGRVCTIELCDESGTAIQATMWKDAIDKYDAILEVGKVGPYELHPVDIISLLHTQAYPTLKASTHLPTDVTILPARVFRSALIRSMNTPGFHPRTL